MSESQLVDFPQVDNAVIAGPATEDLDILFINPPYERLKGFTIASVPNGMLTMATYLSSQGYKTRVYDSDTSYDEGVLVYNNENRANSQNNYIDAIENDDHYVWAEIRKTIAEFNPKFVGMTLMTPTLHSGIKVAEIAKEMGITVIIGGPHANIAREKLVEHEKFDYVFFGEAEYSVSEFLDVYPDVDKLRSIQGIGFMDGERPVFTGFAERVKDLDIFPYPQRNLLVYPERYLPTDMATIMASRGCPFKCTFCASVPIWGRNTIFRSPEHILEEITYLHDTYNTKEFRFFDDVFTINKKKLIQVCKLIVEKYGERYFSWWCLSAVPSIDDEVLTWLKKAGCTQIKMGIESGSERIIDLIQKGSNKEESRNAILLAKKYGFWVNCFFITGFPFETEEDIRETMAFIDETKPDSINLCTFTPYPGTALYTYCVDNGLLEHDETYEIFAHIGHHSSQNFFMKDMSKEKYESLRDECLELTTRLSERMTYRKFRYRLRNLTMKKLIRKLNVKSRRLRAHWKGPGHLLVEHAELAERNKRRITDGVGGLTIESSFPGQQSSG
jgi:radical SAM superfamily enzyme YgiQ (UPF0313 family)